MSKFTIDLAKKEDNPGLQKVLANTPMDGRIQIIFQRQPDFLQANLIGNKLSQTIVARNSENEIVGLGTRSVRTVYVNGQISDVGYLSDLRLWGNYRKSTLVARGYNYLKNLHNDQKVSIYLTTVAEENKAAIKMLTSKKAGLPEYRYFGAYNSFAINLAYKKKTISQKSIKIVRGSQKYINDIINCLNRNGAQKQFYPYYSSEDFNGLKLLGFRIEDFFIAVKDGEVVGVLGKWDLRCARQIIVAGYNGSMKVIKPIYNICAKIFRFPSLPGDGEEVRSFFISFIAVDDNDVDIFKMLLREAYNSYLNSEYSHFVVGLDSRDPLMEAIKDYSSIKYKTNLYIVGWKDVEGYLKTLDGRMPYLEVATL